MDNDQKPEPLGHDASPLGDACAQSHGAVWTRVDLHLHTPAVDSFTADAPEDLQTPAGRRAVADRWAEAVASAGIELAGLADYNGIRPNWIEPLRDAAVAHGFALLPGTELSIGRSKANYHVLATFASDVDADEVNRFLQGEDSVSSPLFDESDRSCRSLELKLNGKEFLWRLRERFPDVLLTLAHPAKEKGGVLEAQGPVVAAEWLADRLIDAVEWMSARDEERLISTGSIQREDLERLAIVDFSDPHTYEEIRTKTRDGAVRATYLRLSSRMIDSVRLALHDPALRVRTGKRPAPARHPRIEAMAVDGGFLGGLRLRFSDELSALIGPRGAGKSAVLEALRFALDIPPHRTDLEGLVKKALGSGGRVAVRLVRSTAAGDMAYDVIRTYGEDPQVVEARQGAAVDVAPTALLGADGAPLVLGQREIQQVAESQRRRRALLDELVGEEAHQADRRIEDLKRRLEENAQQLIDLDERLDGEEDQRNRVRQVEYDIQQYEEQGVAAKLGQHTAVSTDEQALRRAHELVAAARETLEDAFASVDEELTWAPPRPEQARPGQAEADAAIAAVASLRADVTRAAADAGRALEAAKADINAARERHQAAVAPHREELDRLKRQIDDDYLDPDGLLRLTQELTRLQDLLREYGRYQERRTRLADDRRAMLQELRDGREEAFELRRERCEAADHVVHGKLELACRKGGDTEDFRARLGRVLQGSRLTTDAIERLATGTRRDGWAIVEAVEQGEVAQRFDVSDAMARRLGAWLTDSPDRRYELEIAAPEDHVGLALVVDGVPKPLDELSLGQQATGVLLLLFALTGRPLVLDQPEDDLDNAFISDAIIPLIRDAKSVTEGASRQLIVATHNANIPVLGDAELVLDLRASPRHMEVRQRASIDDDGIRGRITELLEGGRDAFQRRSEKYGLG